MSDVASRVARRVADLNPSLGFPGGTCQVIERIRNEIRNPKLQENLINQVEHGKALSNPEARKVYDLERERGAGLFKQIAITPHAQYRMDQRGVGVPQLRATFQTFSKLVNDWKSQKSPKYRDYALKVQRGEPIRWVDPRSKTVVVFAVKGTQATIITVYEDGHPDPRPQDEESCRFEPYFENKATALKVAARYLEAGIIEPPPKLVAAITPKVLSIICGHYWAHAKRSQDSSIRILNNPADREHQDEYRQEIAEFQRAINICKKYATKPKSYRSKATFDLTLDLTGWKYLKGKTDDARYRTQREFNDIKVVINFDPRLNSKGSWEDHKHRLTLDVQHDAAWPWEIKLGLASITKTLVHELRHAAQSILDVLNFVGAKSGLPGSDIRTDPTDYRARRPEWALRDIEFQPIVGDATQQLIERLRKTLPEHRDALVKTYLGETGIPVPPNAKGRYWEPNENLLIFKKKAPQKYKDAIGEIYKGVGGLL